MFKVGDRVRCVDDGGTAQIYGLKAGNVYTVVAHDDDGEVVVEGHGVNETAGSWLCNRFALVAPVAPADGWRAVWAGVHAGDSMPASQNTLLSVVEDADHLAVMFRNNHDGGGSLQCRYFEKNGRWGENEHHYLIPVSPPAPARRPPTREEVAALGFVRVRRKFSPVLGSIAWLDDACAGILGGYGDGGRTSFEDLAEHWEYSRDGKAWSEFWVEGQA